MYFARAMSNGAKWYTPDVFSGPIYTPDELNAASVIDEPTVVDVNTGELLMSPTQAPATPVTPSKRDRMLAKIARMSDTELSSMARVEGCNRAGPRRTCRSGGIAGRRCGNRSHLTGPGRFGAPGPDVAGRLTAEHHRTDDTRGVGCARAAGRA
jgi:hypothetical protein